MAAGTMATNPQPSLLGIPPELRNRIYTYVLVSSRSINVFKVFNCVQPPLLSVNRQIRNEAIGIYYTDNKFHFEACQSAGAEVKPFCELQKKYRKDKQVKLPAYICKHPEYLDINNLWKWLKAYHEDGVTVPSLPQDATHERRQSKDLVTRTFGVVDAMRALPWKKVEAVLDTFFWCIEMFEDTRTCEERYEDEFGYEDEGRDSDEELELDEYGNRIVDA